MMACDNCGYEAEVFDKGEFGDDYRYTHGRGTPIEQRRHAVEVYDATL